MNRRLKNILAITAAVFLTLSVFIVLCLWITLRPIRLQMIAGREFMEALTPNEIQYWMLRADEFLIQHDPNTGIIENPPVPEELKEAKVMSVRVWPENSVTFSWMGGLDHSELVFRKNSDGSFTVTAVYSDYEKKQLWPIH